MRVTLPFEIILPDSTTGHLPLFAEADLARVSNDHGNICTVRREILNSGTLLSVTTEAYSATGYRGVRYAAPDVGLPQPNDTMFAYHNRRWYQWNAILQAWVITSGPSGWVGAWDTEDAAEHAVTAVGDTFYADDELPRRVQRVTAYTAPAAADVDYACLPEPSILALQNRPLLPAPDSTNIGEFVEVNAAGDGYVTAAVALEEEIYAIPPDDITQVGDLITMANIPPLTDGLLLYFTAEGANTAGLTLSIEGTTYNVLKSAGASGAELFEGGEIENGLPLQLVYDNGEGTFYWFGTVLGSAARRDVGTEQNELVALNDNGRISSTLLGENPVVGYSLSFTATGPAWTEEVSGGGGGGDDAYDWATEGNDAILIPALKIPDLDAAKIVSGTFDRDRIPFDAGTVESFLESQITYTGSGTSLEFDGHGTGNAVFGSIKAFQYRAAFTASDSGLRASYNGDAFANIIIKASNGINRQMTLNDFTRYDYFLIQKASPNWVLVGGSVAASRHPDSYTNTLADNRIAPWARNFSPSGTAPTVRLGTGTAGTSTFLRGDGTWAAAGGGTTLDIAGLPNLPSFEISDLDVMVTEDVSDSNTQKHFTIGELADRLADGSSITATGGTLTAAAGGGGGDITAVTTAINSGLEGGDTDGDVALSLDVSNLQSYISTISSADHVALSDEGEAGDPTRRLSLNQLAHWQSLQDNGGIAATNGQFHIQPDELLLSTTPANHDRLIGWDQSASVTRAFQFDTLRSFLRDGVVDGGSVSGTTLTLERSGLSDVTITGLPSGGGGLTSVLTESPISGTGTAGDPVTVADGTINLQHLVAGARYHRGDWNSVQIYARGQSVEHDGHLWVNALGTSAGDEPTSTSTVWFRIDHHENETRDEGTSLGEAHIFDCVGAGITCTLSNGVLSINVVSGSGGLSITSLPNIPSTSMADRDVMVLEDVSDSDTQKHFTLGELAARLADQTTITSAGGTLSAVAGEDGTLAHTLLGSVTLAATPNADAAFVVPLTSEPEDGGLIQIKITSGTGTGVFAAGITYVSSTFSSDDYNDLTVVTTPGMSETLYGANALVVSTARPNTNKLPSVGGAISVNRGASTMFIRQTDYANRYGLSTVNVYMVAVDGAGGGGATLDIYDQLTFLTDNADSIRFTGSGVTASLIGQDVRVFVPGGGTADGVLDGGSYTGGTLTLERSVGADVTVTGLTEPFDLHDDVTRSITAMAANDRLLISDEGAAGDPNVWINFRNLLNSLRGITSSNNATPQGVDRLFITDESESGDPVEYITIDALRTAIGTADGVVDGGSVAGTTMTLTRTVGADIAITGLDPFDTAPIFAGNPAGADRILIRDVSQGTTEYLSFLSFKGDVSPQLRDEGTQTGTYFDILNFTGDGVTCSQNGTLATCNIPGGGGGGDPFDLHDDVTVLLTTLDAADRLVLSDESMSGDPNEYTTVQGLLDGFRDITNVAGGNNSSPTDTDRIFISQEALPFDPVKYTTIAQLRTVIGGGGFEIHDLPQQTQQLATTDRIPLSDESASGDPNEYMTAFNFFSSIRDVVNTNRTTPLDNDRMYVTREDTAGDPLGYITVAQLQTRIGGGGGTTLSIAGLPQESSSDLADTDIMVIENVSESNVQRRLTMGSLSAFLADGSTITSAGGKLTSVGPTAEQLVPTGGVPGNVLTRVGATGAEFSGPVGDGVVEGGSVTGTTLTLRRTQSLADVTITGLPSGGGTADGVLDGGSYAGGTLTLGRSVGADVTITGLPEPFDLHDDVTTEITSLGPSDRLLVSDESRLGDPNQYTTAQGLLNGFRDMTNVTGGNNSSPNDLDRIFISDEDVAFDPVKYTTVGQLRTVIGAEPFHLHNDVTTANNFLDRNDRILVSDESIGGDPNEYMTARSFLNGLRDIIDNNAYNNPTPQDADRLFISDESAVADPVDYITMGQLKTAITADVEFTPLHTQEIARGNTNVTFFATGFTGWTDRTLLHREHRASCDPVERYETETFTIFVDELMSIPATTAGTAFDLDGADRNGLGMHFTDRGSGAVVHLAIFGRTAAGELLAGLEGSTVGGFHPLRAVAQ